MLKDVDRRATEGIRQATLMANQADQHALDAGNRAQQANATAQQASTRLQTVEQVVGNLDQYQAANELELRFHAGQLALSQREQDALDKIAAELQSQRGYIIEVQAFSLGRGEAAVRTSQKMADAVVRYFVLNHEIPVYRIYELGMGNAHTQKTAAGSSTYGNRVEVTVLEDRVDQLAEAGQGSGYTSGSQGGGIGRQPRLPLPSPRPALHRAESLRLFRDGKPASVSTRCQICSIHRKASRQRGLIYRRRNRKSASYRELCNAGPLSLLCTLTFSSTTLRLLP